MIIEEGVALVLLIQQINVKNIFINKLIIITNGI